jgi:carboxymethylenebutenolidase
MKQTRTEIELADGTAAMDVFRPDGPGLFPAVLFYMDGIGVRDALREMAARFAAGGYYVVLPDLYYRSQPFAPFDAATAFANEAERARLMPMIMKVTNEPAMKDTARVLDWLDAQPEVRKGPVGCVGYCLGGRLALVAAGAFPERVAAAASIHGGRMVTPAPDSPHLGAPKIRARMYFAAAEVDPSFTPEDRAQLETALRSAGVRYTMDVLPAAHGFAVHDTPMYDRAAAERHYEQVGALFQSALGAQT